MAPASHVPVLAALVLAGGRARRMGGTDKPLLALGGQALVARVAAALAAPGRALAVSANGDPARFDFLGLPVLADAEADFPGPLAGVLAGLVWARGLGAQALVTAPVDCPFVPPDLAARLSAGARGTIAHARAGGRDHPTCALWPLEVEEALARYLASGERRMMGFLAQEGAVAVDFADEAAFFNVNTPEDLAAAEAKLPQRANT